MKNTRGTATVVDKMRTVPLAKDGTAGFARIHGVLLVDHGSCNVPKGETLTLEEWKTQQAA